MFLLDVLSRSDHTKNQNNRKIVKYMLAEPFGEPLGSAKHLAFIERTSQTRAATAARQQYRSASSLIQCPAVVIHISL
jgi:hypothetical protein